MLQMEQDVDLELLREREQALHQLEVSECNRVRGQGVSQCNRVRDQGASECNRVKGQGGQSVQ